MWALRLRALGFVGLFMLSLSGLCWAEDSQPGSYYIMTEDEYQALMTNCETLKTNLQTSLTNLEQSELTRKQLEQSLTDYQMKINDLLQKTTDLENSLILSEQESLTLKDELETLQKSFKAYTKEVNSKLWKARIKSLLIGLVIGAGIGYYANK